MARSAAGLQEQEEPKKKKQMDIREWFNQTVELATKGKRWSLDDIKNFEEAGRESRIRQVRPAPAQRIAAVVPKRELEMTRPAIQAALKLAETFETAGSGRTLRLDAWIKAGRMA